MTLKNISSFILLSIINGLFCCICCKIACNYDKKTAFFIGYIGASLIEALLMNINTIFKKDI